MGPERRGVEKEEGKGREWKEKEGGEKMKERVRERERERAKRMIVKKGRKGRRNSNIKHSIEIQVLL